MDNIYVLVVYLEGRPHVKLAKRPDNSVQIGAFNSLDEADCIFWDLNVEDIPTLVSMVVMKATFIEVPADVEYIKKFMGTHAKDLTAAVGTIMVHGTYAEVRDELITEHICHSAFNRKLGKLFKSMEVK